MQKKIVMFVCKGNIHRSVIAELCLKQELEKFNLSNQFKVISRGIQGCCGTAMPKHENMTQYEIEWSLTKPILEKLGIDLLEIARHIARPIEKGDVQKADIVYAMELTVLGKSDDALPNSLRIQFPEYFSKMHFFGELEDRDEELLDCGGSADPDLHLLVNERIVYAIRKNIQRIIVLDSKGEKND